jgi:4,5-dihydroxyphthalate decarboxylase
MTLSLSLVCANYDRTRPILDGRVKIDGVSPVLDCLDHEDMFVRALTTAEFDVTELSFGRHVRSVALGQAAYVGIPVFLSRTFRHSAIYVRPDRGIGRPDDLRGRRFGVREYGNTATLTARGLLADEHGVGAHEIAWVMGDVDHRERDRVQLPALADGIALAAAPRLLSDMLADGEIDGLIDYQPPRCFVAGHPQVRRLFPDHQRVEHDYYRRTGLFPIMHLLGLRRSLAEANPWLPNALFDAFTEAKRIAMADLYAPGAPKITLPWITEEYQRTVALMGHDFWPYGIAANRTAIAAMCRYVQAQGLVLRAPAIETLFAFSLLQT